MLEAGIVSSARQADAMIHRVPPHERETTETFRKIWAESSRPTAIIFGLERQGIWGIRAIHHWNIRVPQELAMVTLEGGLVSRHLVPRLTNVPRPDFEAGVWVGKILAKLFQSEPLGQRDHLIPVALEEMETT
jgi:DNA-binding LacI/PurR family transcriptional regulator